MRKPDPAASLVADMRHLPLCVTGGILGYRLSFTAGEFCQPVTHTGFAAEPAPPIEFRDMFVAKALGDLALTATHDLLERVRQTSKS